MKSSLSNLIMFTAGAAIGSVATWYFVKSKYEQIAQEEIDSVKEVFSKFVSEEKAEEPEIDIQEEVSAAESIIEEQGYTNYSNIKQEKGDAAKMNRPMVISSEEFDDLVDYEVVCLTYYSDGVLADEFDEPIVDVENTVGEESLSHFGDDKDDPDTIYVKDDDEETRYEIVLDSRRFADVCVAD